LALATGFVIVRRRRDDDLIARPADGVALRQEILPHGFVLVVALALNSDSAAASWPGRRAAR